MLQFLKKSSRKKDLRSSASSSSLSNYEVGNPSKTNKYDNTNEVNEEFTIADAEKLCVENKESLTESQLQRSRLSKNLCDILSDKNCLCYFVQFLEAQQALALIKFWLDVESYRTAAEIITNNNNNNCKPLATTPNVLATPSTKSQIILSSSDRRKLNKSVSSDGYDSLSYTSLDYDSISCSYDDDEEEEEDEEDRVDENDDDTGTSASECYKMNITDDEKIDQKNHSRFNSSLATDAIRIYRKYLISNSNYYVDMPATILSHISLSLGSTTNNLKISSKLFDDAQQHVFKRLDGEYLNSFLESIYYCKFTIDVLTSNNLKIYDVINNDSILFYFMDYLEKYNERYYLDFLIITLNYKKEIVENSLDYNHKQSQADAMIIYDKYFSLQSDLQLNLSTNIRYLIEENICCNDDSGSDTNNSDNSKKLDSCFDLPIVIVDYYLNKKYFSKFIKSNYFYKYLSELFNKIHESKKSIANNNIAANNKRRGQHRKTLSDCTSDNTRNLRNSFISTKNTLLAMESNIFNRNKIELSPATSASTFSSPCPSTSSSSSNTAPPSSNSMSIDSRQLNNPDLLWQRTHTKDQQQQHHHSNSYLSFGRINALGRYERDFDMEFLEHDKWNGNKIKNVVKKFVKLPEDKVQEELAWQVAEMIVKDITNVTLSNSNNPT